MIAVGLIALAAIIVIGILFLLISDEMAILSLIVITLFFVGLADYYLRFEASYWISYGLSAALFGRFAFRRILFPNKHAAPKAPLSIWAVLIFILLLAATTIANGIGGGLLLVGAKIYLPMLLAIPAIAYMDNAERFARALEKGALIMPFIQAPFVVHQHFFVATQRRGGASWDAVVGTFGGNPVGGGANPTLMLFLLISILVAVSMVQDRRLSLPRGALVCVTSIILIGLGEVKAVFLIAPIALLIQQAHKLLRSPIQSAFVIAATVFFGQLLHRAYEAMYWSTLTSQRVASQDQRLEQMLAYIFDPRNINYETGEVGRVASISLWLKDSLTFAERLLGHGAASARVQSSVAVGEVGQRYYPLDVSATAISQLLWDTGLLGLTCFAFVLIFGLLDSRRNAKRAVKIDLRRQMTTISAILGMLIVFLPYNRFIVDRAAEQLVMAICLGLVWRFNVASMRRWHPKRLTERMVTSA